MSMEGRRVRNTNVKERVACACCHALSTGCALSELGTSDGRKKCGKIELDVKATHPNYWNAVVAKCNIIHSTEVEITLIRDL